MDISKIAGYEDMTLEEKVKALEAYQVEDRTDEYQKLKESFNKASADVASYKKKLKEKQTEQENLAMERAEEEEKLKRAMQEQAEELEKLKKKTKASEYVAQLVGLGFGSKLAEDTANAMVDGKQDEVFKSIAQFKVDYKSALEKEKLKNQPDLTKGKKPKTDESDKLKGYFGL